MTPREIIAVFIGATVGVLITALGFEHYDDANTCVCAECRRDRWHRGEDEAV